MHVLTITFTRGGARLVMGHEGVDTQDARELFCSRTGWDRAGGHVALDTELIGLRSSTQQCWVGARQ